MAAVPGDVRTRRSRAAVGYARRVVGAVHCPTTRAERLMLGATIVVLPLQTAIPAVAGFNFLYFVFALLAGYVILHRPGILDRTFAHPVFLAAYVLLIVGALMEFAHPNPLFGFLSRIGGMVAGAALVATLCRDRAALRAAVYGYLIAGVWVSVLTFATSYTALRGATPSGFGEATTVREAVFLGSPLIIELNLRAFITAQAAVVALAFVLTTASPVGRNLFCGVLIVCSIATFLPMSRGGLVIAAVSCAAVIWAHGVTRLRSIVTPIVVGAVLLVSVPVGVFSRLSYSAQTATDVRAKLYEAIVQGFPEYIMTGVGVGNFEDWGFRHGLAFYMGRRTAKLMGLSEEDFTPGLHVLGAHNCFLQVTILWGLPALLALLALTYQAYMCVPKRPGTDVLALSLRGIAVSSLLWAMVVHVFDKSFSLTLGLLVGYHLWIWARGDAPRLVGGQSRSDAAPVSAS